jgi:hypothetical protein
LLSLGGEEVSVTRVLPRSCRPRDRAGNVRMSRNGFLSSAVWAMAALLAVITHLPAFAVAPAEWQVLSHKDGLLIERRANEGSGLYEGAR